MFTGFSPTAPAFLRQLAANNRKDWFEAHKHTYKNELELPARAFMEAMLERLGPEVSARLFRVHRDLRFSKDKTPYNTYLRIGFSEAHRAGRFFSLERDSLILGGGCLEFDKPTLERYRERVAGPDGEALAHLVADLSKAGYQMHEPELKKVPAPYSADHIRGPWLRRKSLAIWRETPIPPELSGPGLVDYCLGAYTRLAPFDNWLKEVL